MGGSVVKDLLSPLGENHYHVYFDNLFTSLPLLNALQDKRITGTRNSKDQSDLTLTPSKLDAVEKKTRGVEYHKLDANSNINSVVTVPSTGYDVTPLRKATMWIV